MELSPDTESDPKEYRAFVLRWWQERVDLDMSQLQWRFLLEDLHEKGSRQGFYEFELLVAYLESQLASPPEKPKRDAGAQV